MTPKRSAASRLQQRTLADLTPVLDKKLLGYAAAASAAGVGLLTPQAEAKIIYTPANVPITLNGPVVQLDLNNDGVVDFGLYNFFSNFARGIHPEGAFQSGLFAVGYQAGDEVWSVESKATECAVVLPKGAKVGPSDPFHQSPHYSTGPAAIHEAQPTVANGRMRTTARFLAWKFVISGQTHYGWAHVTVNGTDAVLNGYAYETVPNKSILTGAVNGPDERAAVVNHGTIPPAQPATLDLLAQGERGLAVWRKSDEPESVRLL